MAIGPSERATEDEEHQSISRRRFLRQATIFGLVPSAAWLLQSCGAPAPAAQAPAAAPTAAPGGQPTSAAAQPTAAPTTAAVAKPTAAPQAAPATQQPAAAPSDLKAIPRSRTLIMEGVPEAANQFSGDVTMQNPFLPGISRSGFQVVMEPLYFYNAYHTDTTCGPPGVDCTGGEIPWLATGYKFNADFTQLTVDIRKGVEWSDGQPFTAADVVFTVTMLKDNAPKLTSSADMKQWVKEVSAPNDLTVQFTLTDSNPRFFHNYFQFHQDLGIQIVPQHIFKGQDPQTFAFFDLDKGWPVTTGPYKLVNSDAGQKMWDRRDDWWGVKTGFHPLPEPERLIFLPGYASGTQLNKLINNEADTTFVLTMGDVEAAIKQNPKINSWTGSQPPYGNVDYWTTVLGFNDAKPPYDDPDMRRAVNYAVNRDELLKIANKGGGEPALVPLAALPGLRPYIDSVQDLTEKYDVGTFSLAKSAEILQSKGYTKDSTGVWAKDGQRLTMNIVTFSLFEDVTPVLVSQLRKGGFDASFKMPADMATLVMGGQAEGFVWGGNLSVLTPDTTLKMYQQGGAPWNWKNDAFDKIVDQMFVTGSDDPKMKSLFHDAMDLWLKDHVNVPLVQLYARTPFNTTYWTNWPDQANPYVNTIFIHRTFLMIVCSLKAAAA